MWLLRDLNAISMPFPQCFRNILKNYTLELIIFEAGSPYMTLDRNKAKSINWFLRVDDFAHRELYWEPIKPTCSCLRAVTFRSALIMDSTLATKASMTPSFPTSSDGMGTDPEIPFSKSSWTYKEVEQTKKDTWW